MSNSVSGGIPEPKAQHSGIRRNGSLSTLYHRLMMAKYQIRVHVLIPSKRSSRMPLGTTPRSRLFIGSILVGMGLTFVLTWGSVIIGSAFFALLASLAFLAAASFWIVLGLFVTIFAARLAYNLQKNVAEKFRHSKVVKELYNHAHEKRLHQQQQNGLDEKVA
ncbi:hypothetical protein PCASD_08850 [Puccinia coronata f. sp. avenae]|uniref:Uncharacterized protein n=1 Tax=Puccinia coronata f. sp. avenae TaxID=200324 RepID=A0A2N5URY0_9BASI|nr:hypothetical protein PCASD_08850 [Puccinia coronata f. sp. avenae]